MSNFKIVDIIRHFRKLIFSVIKSSFNFLKSQSKSLGEILAVLSTFRFKHKDTEK